MVQFDQYTWIFALGTIFSFVCAFGIGANDVANSFATSVGSRALTMPQALMIAAVCEFLGALLLGAGVTDTVKNKIANVGLFTNTPELLMFGMLAVMITAGFWDNFACHLELPVSTTHTTVGAIVGMAWVIRGRYAVVWSKLNINPVTKDNDFPYLKGMSIIFLQWVVSPLSAGLFVFVLFGLLRTFVLRSPHSFTRAFYIFPVLVLLTFFVVTFFIIQTGNKNASWDSVSDSKAVWVSVVVAVGATILTAIFIMPLLYRAVHAQDARRERLETDRKLEEAKIEAGELDPKEAARLRGLAEGQAALDKQDTAWNRTMEKMGVRKFAETGVGKLIFGNAVVRALSYGANYKMHDVIETDERLTTIWQGAEVFDFKTERLFRYLQVFSAMVMSFAHGSNDVANAMGPYSAVYTIWNTKKVPSKTTVEKWILAYGGAGIVIGLATYGYKIMQVFGVKSVKLTNARGFCAELATAGVVILSSRYGLPVSTTQTLTGAVLTIGLFEGAKGVNWRVFVRIFGGWVVTICVAALIAAAITSFGVYAPSKVAADDNNYVASYVNNQALRMIRQMNTSAAGVPVRPALNTLSKTVNALLKNPVKQPYDYVRAHNATFGLYNSTLASRPL